MRSAAPPPRLTDVAGDDRAVVAGDLVGAVARAVVDDQHRGRLAADLAGHPIEHLADVVGLVVGGDQDRDPVAEALGVPGGAELLPGEPLERRRRAAARRASSAPARAASSRNRIRIANIATPTIRVPFSRSNENASSSASGISVAGDDRQPERDQRAGSARRRCAARAGARSRSRRPRAPSTSPTARIAVSSGGRRVCAAVGTEAHSVPSRGMRILILGGDGYLGWPTAMRFSARGHEVAVVDNFSRRRWHTEHSTDSLTPIALARRPDRGLARGLRATRSSPSSARSRTSRSSTR